jgi:hypothetical protein
MSIRVLEMSADYMRPDDMRPTHLRRDQVVAWGLRSTSGSALGGLQPAEWIWLLADENTFS